MQSQEMKILRDGVREYLETIQIDPLAKNVIIDSFDKADYAEEDNLMMWNLGFGMRVAKRQVLEVVPVDVVVDGWTTYSALRYVAEQFCRTHSHNRNWFESCANPICGVTRHLILQLKNPDK